MLGIENYTTVLRDYHYDLGAVVIRKTMTVQEFEEKYPENWIFYCRPESKHYRKYERG